MQNESYYTWKTEDDLNSDKFREGSAELQQIEKIWDVHMWLDEREGQDWWMGMSELYIFYKWKQDVIPDLLDIIQKQQLSRPRKNSRLDNIAPAAAGAHAPAPADAAAAYSQFLNRYTNEVYLQKKQPKYYNNPKFYPQKPLTIIDHMKK